MHIKGSGILRFTNTKPQDILICVSTITIPGLFLDVGFSFALKMCASALAGVLQWFGHHPMHQKVAVDSSSTHTGSLFLYCYILCITGLTDPYIHHTLHSG